MVLIKNRAEWLEQVFGPLQSKLKDGLKLIPLEVDVSSNVGPHLSPLSSLIFSLIFPTTLSASSWTDHSKVVGSKAYVEFKGEATQNNGKPYNNNYLWVMIFNEDGHAFEIREYLDTGLVREVFASN